jgi:hypothetical protein
VDIGRLLASIFQIFPAVYRALRPPVGIEGEAWLCDWDHVMVVIGDTPLGTGPRHIDVRLRLWNRSGQAVTLLDLDSATLNHQELKECAHPDFDEVTLPPGGTSTESYFAVCAREGETLTARAGDQLTIRFRPSAGMKRFGPRIKLTVLAKAPDS